MNFRVGHQLRKRGKVALGMVDTSEKELTEGKMPCTVRFGLDWIGLDWIGSSCWLGWRLHVIIISGGGTLQTVGKIVVVDAVTSDVRV